MRPGRLPAKRGVVALADRKKNLPANLDNGSCGALQYG